MVSYFQDAGNGPERVHDPHLAGATHNMAVQVDDAHIYADLNLVKFQRPQNVVLPESLVNGFFPGCIRFLDWAGAFSGIGHPPVFLTPGKFIRIGDRCLCREHRCSFCSIDLVVLN
jgi:hypothetical protein